MLLNIFSYNSEAVFLDFLKIVDGLSLCFYLFGFISKFYEGLNVDI